MSTPLPVSPAIATIDQNNFLVINWNPPALPAVPPNLPSPGYSGYLNFPIFMAQAPFLPPGNPQTVNGHTPTGLEFAGSTNDSRLYQEQLVPGDWGLNMQAEPTANAVLAGYAASPEWNASEVLLLFPTTLQATDVTLDNTTLELGQTVTVTLGPNYPETTAGANFWQINWPDGTSTGPLPLSSRSAAKSFTTPGSFNIVVQTWNDYSALTPPVKLYRSLSVPILVVNQQFNPQAAAQGSLTGTLGFGGQTQFEIVGASSTVVLPQPYVVVARCLARDTQTNELKGLFLVTRFSNASSELGSMAMDVFPLEGRPHAKELIVPEQILEVTSNTTAIPVSITVSTLPNVIVGKTMAQFKMSATGGIQPYGWYNDGTLPPGLQLSIDGTLSGTPTQLGTFNVNFAVIDSGTPAYIAEVTLPMTVATDLKITTTTIANAQVLTPYNQPLAFTGGLAPYTWSIAAGAFPIGIVIDPSTGLLNGTPCTYNSTTDYSTSFTATVQITDSIGAVATQTYTITLAPAALQFGPIDQGRIFPEQDFVLTVPVFGGKSPYTFDPTKFLTSDGFYDTPVFSDGRVEIRAGNIDDSPPNPIPTNATGIHNIGFSIGAIKDSSGPQQSSPLTGLSYAIGQQISDLRIEEAFFRHYWDFNDATAVSVNIIGDLQGFSLGPDALAPSNGLNAVIIPSLTPTAALDGIAQVGDGSPPTPPTSYQNSELRFPLQLFNGLVQVAQISRPYTLLAHDDQAVTGDVGTITTVTKTYVVNDFVALNPRKPNYNSPTPDVISSFSPAPPSGSPPVAATLIAQVAAASSLPTGLSLDANTGLIYGYLLAPATTTSIINYVDSSNLVHGTVTINWSTVPSAFTLVNNGGLDDLVFGTAYAAINAFTSPNVTITGVSVFNASNNPLPQGLTVSTDGTNIIVSGTPAEAGYFDVWFAATSASNGTAYAYYRVSVDYTVPLVILTSSLPTISAQPYDPFLQGFGGIPPYLWGASDTINGPWAVISNIAAPTTGNFLGLSLNVLTGYLSGTLTSPPGTSPTDLGSITFSLTDSRGTTVTSALDLGYNNNLRITTNQLATVTNDTNGYSFKVEGAGGIPPYYWQITPSAPLPSGISFSSVAPTPPAAETTTPPGGGWFTGTWPGTPSFSGSVTIALTDSTPQTVTKPFTIDTGVWDFTINSSGVGTISRGVAYNGTMSAVGTFTAPVQWEVAPNSAATNLLPTGLSLQVNGTGATASIVGTYSGAFLTNFPVRIVAVDILGNTAETILLLNTVPHSVTITTTSLPNAVDTVSYSAQLTATGGVGPYTFVIDPSTTGYINSSTIPTSGGSPTGLTLNNANGQITGTATTVWSNTIKFVASDSLTPPNTSVVTPLSLTAQAAGLVITTTQANLNANQPFSGKPYSMVFTAAGDVNTPYTWSISPSSPNQLPAGLTLAAQSNTTATVSGTTTATGYNKNVIIRVTDSINAYTEATFNFVVTQPLALMSGIDFEDSTLTYFLGYVDNGPVGSIVTRPNQSFIIVATGVQSQTAGGLNATVGYPNITATPQTPGTINGVSVPGAAAIVLSGSGFNQAPGTYSFVFTLTDSGVTVSHTFTWTVYNHGTSLVLAPSSGSLPTQLAPGTS
jgi:hypothetical protein